VAQSYYGALLAQRQSQLQLQIVQQDLVQERLISAQIRAGTVAPIDLKTAEIPTAQARVGVVRAQGSELAADAAFAVAMGLPADATVLPLDDQASTDESALPAGTTLEYNRAIALSLLMRPDYLAAEQQVGSSAENLRVARLGRWPVVGVGASGGFQSYGSGLAAQSFTQATASLNFPIYDQGITNASVLVATAQQEEALAELETNRLVVESDVRRSLVQLVAAQRAFALTDDELAKTRDVQAATQMQYRAGQTTLSLLLNAQTQLSQAETDRLTARYALRTAEQNYLYALGENDLAEEVRT
jgi:outer membrane protein